jgi:lysophospholipase L1-like esterase
VSGTVTLCGDSSLSSASGVRVHKLGASGSRLNQWVARDATNQQAGWAMLALDCVTIMDGTNSQINGVPPATWYSEMTTLVGRFRAACPGIDVGIIMPPENQRVSKPVAMSAYAAQGREAAVALNTAFMDLQSAFGANPDDYRFDSANPLFADDLTHPLPTTGGYLMQGEVMRLLKPF